MFLPLFEFGEFRLDCGRFEILRNGRSLRIERKPLELLILLVERRGQLVSRDEIAQQLWKGDVFVDTEHGINTAIRKIRSVLRDKPEEPIFIHTVTGKGYCFIAPVVQISPAPAAPEPDSPAPATEIPSSPSNPSLPQRSVRKGVWGLLGGLLACCAILGCLAAGWFVLRPHHATGHVLSIAILPIVNRTGDPDQEYFVDGMTDELIRRLARDSTLRIASRASVMQYKGAHQPLPQIARALHVDGIVEGSVERSGQHVQMTLQLIRRDNTKLWARSYDRNITDVATLPEEAAKGIAKRLNSSASSAASRVQINPQAQDAYLHGRYMWFAGNNGECVAYMQLAIRLQPDYAAAWTGLAEAYAAEAVAGLVPPADAFRKSEAASRQALELDDSLPEAHHSLAAFYLFSAWDWQRAEAESRQAIQLNSNVAEFHHLYSYILFAQNRDHEAMQQQIQATQINPFDRSWGLGAAYTRMHQYDKAIHELETRSSTSQPNYEMQQQLAKAFWFKGMKKEWAAHIEQSYRILGDEPSAEVFHRAFSRGGAPAAAQWLLDQDLKKEHAGYLAPLNLAFDYALLMRRQDTLRELDAAYRERSPWLVLLQMEPAFDFLHSDPRYHSLVQRIGLPVINP